MCQELERQAERAKLVAAHDGLDLEYLKNIMLKLYETGEPHTSASNSRLTLKPWAHASHANCMLKF